MDKKAGKHSEIMAFLRSYIAETPLEILQKEITEVSNFSFVGATAEEYFAHFPLYYEKSATIYEPNYQINFPYLYGLVWDKTAQKGIDFNDFSPSKSQIYTKQIKNYRHVS